MAAPSVYSAVNAITAELASAGIPKSHTNTVDQYQYRSIDDVLNRLSPLLAKHRLCVLPQVLERDMVERCDGADQLLMAVTLKVAFTLVSGDDGSSHIVEVYGEALDSGDKGTAKAMSAAYKLAMLQAFCIPVHDSVDADSISHKLAAKTHAPEPVQGWEQWVRDINDIAEVCESQQAIDVVQDRNRGLLKSLSRERAPLYAELGECFAMRRQVLRDREKPRNRKPRGGKTTAASPVRAEVTHG